MGAAPVQKSPALRDYILKAQNVPTNFAVARFGRDLGSASFTKGQTVYTCTLSRRFILIAGQRPGPLFHDSSTSSGWMNAVHFHPCKSFGDKSRSNE